MQRKLKASQEAKSLPWKIELGFFRIFHELSHVGMFVFVGKTQHPRGKHQESRSVLFGVPESISLRVWYASRQVLPIAASAASETRLASRQESQRPKASEPRSIGAVRVCGLRTRTPLLECCRWWRQQLLGPPSWGWGVW